MDDLKHRMKEWWEYDPGHIIPQALARIEALERQVKAADALADALETYNRGGAGPLTGWLDVEEALAAYRATKEGGE